MNHICRMTRLLPYRHLLSNNLRLRELRYPVEYFGNYIKGIKENFYIPNLRVCKPSLVLLKYNKKSGCCTRAQFFSPERFKGQKIKSVNVEPAKFKILNLKKNRLLFCTKYVLILTRKE